MQNARIANNIKIALAVSFLSAALFVPNNVRAAAGGIQNCTTGSTCTVGEFLFNDSSAPIAGATCTITSEYPDQSSFVASQSLSGGTADGWYYYSFTAPATLGVYPTTISCVVSGDTLSIDKSFQVNAAVAATDTNAIASAVWGYSTRTVSSFGSLVSDIWGNTTRTLTSGSSGSSTDSANISHIMVTTDQTRLLIEKVVNQPIIQNVLEDTTLPVGEKIQDTRAMVNQIYVNSQYLTSQSAVVGANWNTASGKDLLASVIDLSQVLGEPGDSGSANTLFGQVNYLRDSWNWDEVTSIYNQLTTAQKMMSDLKTGLADYQKSPVLYQETKSLVKNFAAVEKVVGTAGDMGSEKTLFARIKTTSDLTQSLDNKNTEVKKVLADYSKTGDVLAASTKATDLENQVIALNRVPGVTGALVKANPGDPKSVQNLLLGLAGIISSNQKLLSLGAGKTLINTWLEVGSIIVKTVVTNPSNLISQDVNVKYYLPEELKQEDIIKADPGLTVQYDSEKNQLYVTGIFTLAAGQTKTLSVETKDIWSITSSQLDSLRTQADTLSKPLEKTAYYAQGVTLKSNIDSTLDQIASLQASAATPEEKIKAYREAVILKGSVDTNIAALQNLVAQSSAQGSLFGFVGGSQTIAVWGIVVIVIAGFILLTVYMRTATRKAKAEIQVPKNQVVHKGIHPATFVAVMLISSVVSAGTTGLVVNNLVSKNYELRLNVLGTQTKATPAPEPVSVTAPAVAPAGTGTGGQYIVRVLDTPTGSLNVRQVPLGFAIDQVKVGDKLIFLDVQAGWYKVQLESGKVGWISSQYATKE
jgi:hypothetical protein